MQPAHGLGSRVSRWWRRVATNVSWTPPTSTEIGVVAKSGLAAGLSWWAASAITGVAQPVLAPLTAIVIVQVSVRASVRLAIQRSGAVVLGVLLAVAIGDALGLNGFTVAILVAVSLGIAQLVLRLPTPAARQVPVSALVVLAAVHATQGSSAWHRAADTVIGAAVGVAISLILPASRLVDARQTLDRLGSSLAGALDEMGSGLQQPWATVQTEEWRRRARTTRSRLVAEAAEAVGNGRESARWNVRDRRHVDVLGRFEQILPRLERTAIGVSVISRGLDDHARLDGTVHTAMPAMGQLFIALAGAVRAVVHEVLGTSERVDVARALAEVTAQRERCVRGASRRARLALEHVAEHDEHDVIDGEQVEREWLNYAALLVQVDRIVGDLSAPLPE
jgi:uncharacterized membrane protein YgaE (UPF0421/DUF939 family)